MDRLHPGAVALYLAQCLLLVLYYQHPIFLLGLCLALIAAAALMGLSKSVRDSMVWALPLMVLIIVVNALINGEGRTVLAVLPWPGGGRAVYLEPVIYSLAMSLKLLGLMITFLLVGRFLGPDRLISLSRGRMHKPVLMMALAVRMLPHLKNEMARTIEVLRTRGVRWGKGSLLKRTQSYFPLGKISLISALEGALRWAEAMTARGYGRGPRSRYSNQVWGRRDSLVVGHLPVALGAMAASARYGLGSYQYYSSSSWGMKTGETVVLIILGLLLLIPVVLSRNEGSGIV